MDSPNVLAIFLGMVFVAVFMLSQGLIVPVFGEGGKMRKRLKARLDELDAQDDVEALDSLLREKHLNSLRPWERQLEELPSMENLRKTIEQAGWNILSYRFVLIAIVVAIVLGIAAWITTRIPLAAVLATVIGGAIPFIRLWAARNSRMA